MAGYDTTDIDDVVEEVGFDVELVESAGIGDDNSYRLQNGPGENQRQHIVQQGRPKDVMFHGDLFAVVHGTLTPGGDDATLIIIQFTFVGSEGFGRRFRKVIVKIRFANGENDPHGGVLDPEVRAIAPDGELQMGPASIEEVSTAVSAGVSVSLAEGMGGLHSGFEWSKSTTNTSRVTVFGGKRIEGRKHGNQNTVLWKLQEDKIGQTGVPNSLRAAVLVVPKSQDGFRAIVDVDVNVDALYAVASKVRRLTGQSVVDPVHFSSERVDFGPKLVGVDADNLDACNLAGIAFSKVSNQIGTSLYLAGT